MTVFKATQPVSLTAGNVASIFGFLSHNPFFEVTSGSELKVETHDGSIEVDFLSVAGHPFTYGLHGPTGGLLALVQVNVPAGSIAFKFSHMAVPMATLVSDAQHGHWGAALHLFFGGHDSITGSAGADYLPDFGGHDRITGGAGNDTMSGGGGNDTFVFRAGFGNDVINHFVAGSGANHDKIEVHGIPAAQITVHQMGSTVVISDGMGDSITLNHVKGQFNSHDYHIFT